MEKIVRADTQCILIEERRNAYSNWDGKFSEKKTVSRIFAEYNQRDAMSHNLFVSVGRSTCFRRIFRPSTGAAASLAGPG